VSAKRRLFACACLLLGCRSKAPSLPDGRGSEPLLFAVEWQGQGDVGHPHAFPLAWVAESPRPIESASEERVCLVRHVGGEPDAGVWLPFPAQHMCGKIPEGMSASRWSMAWSPVLGFIGLPFPMGRYRMTLPVRFAGEPRVRQLSTELEVLPDAPLPPVAEILEALRRLAPHACGERGAHALALAAYASGTALTTRLPELVGVSVDKQTLMDLMALLPETHGAVVGFLDGPDAAAQRAAAVAVAGLHQADTACGAPCDRAVAIACGVALQDPSATDYRVLQAVSWNPERWPRGFAGALVSRFEAAVDPYERQQLGSALNACDPARSLGPELLDRAERAAEKPLPGHPAAEAYLQELAARWKPKPRPKRDDGYVDDVGGYVVNVSVPLIRGPADDCPKDLGPALSALEKVTGKVVDLRARAHHSERDGGPGDGGPEAASVEGGAGSPPVSLRGLGSAGALGDD
jgi:hypothetical protein